MICSLCGKNEATAEFEGLINGKVVKFFLCNDCLKSIDIESVLNRSHFSPEDFLSALSASMENGRRRSADRNVCPGCGMTFEEFSRTNTPGCSQCFKSFSIRLKPILRKANPSPKGAAVRVAAAAVQENKLKEIEILKTEMKKAVKLEEYERAAVLRDKIKDLER